MVDARSSKEESRRGSRMSRSPRESSDWRMLPSVSYVGAQRSYAVLFGRWTMFRVMVNGQRSIVSAAAKVNLVIGASQCTSKSHWKFGGSRGL